MLGGDGLVGGNPTMNIIITLLYHRGGGGGDGFFKIIFSCSDKKKYILFVTQLPSWSDGPYFLFGVFLPQPTFCFLNLLFLGTRYIVFCECWDFLYFSSSFFCTLFWVSL